MQRVTNRASRRDGGRGAGASGGGGGRGALEDGRRLSACLGFRDDGDAAKGGGGGRGGEAEEDAGGVRSSSRSGDVRTVDLLLPLRRRGGTGRAHGGGVLLFIYSHHVYIVYWYTILNSPSLVCFVFFIVHHQFNKNNDACSPR